MNISHVYATRKKASNSQHTSYYNFSLHEANVLCGHRVVSGHQPALGKLAEGSDTRPSAQYLCPNLQPIYYFLLRSIHPHCLCQRYLTMLVSKRFWAFWQWCSMVHGNFLTWTIEHSSSSRSFVFEGSGKLPLLSLLVTLPRESLPPALQQDRFLRYSHLIPYLQISNLEPRLSPDENRRTNRPYPDRFCWLNCGPILPRGETFQDPVHPRLIPNNDYRSLLA